VTLPPEAVRAPAGPDARFEVLVRQYQRLIDHVVVRVGGAEAGLLRDDVRQNVLLSIWNQIEHKQDIQHVASYIYKAAVRETIRARRREVERRKRHEAGPAPLRRPSEDPHRALVAREEAQRLEASLAELSPERLQAVRAHLAGFDVSELMTGYGWSYQKARNLVARGMRDLREALRRRGVGG